MKAPLAAAHLTNPHRVTTISNPCGSTALPASGAPAFALPDSEVTGQFRSVRVEFALGLAAHIGGRNQPQPECV